MNEQPSSMSTEQRPGDRPLIRRLLLFFALVYVVEGLAQPDGLIAQPLSYYLKTSQGWKPTQIAAYTSLLYVAWIIKPLYGLISDFVPLFGYRRKSYLVLVNIAAVGGFVWATRLSAPSALFFCSIYSPRQRTHRVKQRTEHPAPGSRLSWNRSQKIVR